MVARLKFTAVFVKLFSTDLAASAAVQNQPHSWGTFGYLEGTLAGGWAGGERLKRENTVKMLQNAKYPRGKGDLKGFDLTHCSGQPRFYGGQVH